MSQENVKAAQRLYPGSLDLVAALNSPETLQALRTAFEPMVHPDFETVADPHYISAVGEAPAGTSRRVVHGIDGFIRTFSDWLEAWEAWTFTPTEFREVDEERVLVEADIAARSKTHGADMVIPGNNLLTFREGRLAKLELFLRREDALEAAGLRE
jgi:hypothetical protein